ncbi:hypothetical protein Tlie_1087 [Thermovirga lienii DSM 17291]|uniref:Peptidase S55 domain-containing protein n=1 Tax=Thermovirga lienii (strain ATCC BAA-1197 / DSM 17291 / Cas60314) TaxID=580340 RepID=G7VAC0_THELD|nr:hypothetical protein Tlie_1087 [Thermovirga lienii DSM 17291]HCD71893.1 peptidase S55 [Thermovirga lienii]
MFRFKLKLLLSIIFILCCCTFAMAQSTFNSTIPVMSLDDIKPGMEGIAYTVVKGQEVVTFPVKVLSVVPSVELPHQLILIQAYGPVIEKTGGIAAGMSGSPVFIDGKLVGAIGYGWHFSEHDKGLVTPISEMAAVWEWPDREIKLREPINIKIENSETEGKKSGDIKNLETPIMMYGVSDRSAGEISEKLGTSYSMLPHSFKATSLPVNMNAKLTPGDAVSVLLAWGDVSIAATGTLTALSKDGRFLAFAHPFLNRGAVYYPLAKAWIHDVIPSVQAPFKIGTPTEIVGVVTQDRPQAIGGYIGKIPTAFDFSLSMRDKDTGKIVKKRFQFVNDPFLLSELIDNILIGLWDDTWERKGEGTAKVDLKIEGGSLVEGWQRTNMFYSGKDLAKDMFSEAVDITKTIMLNPFYEINPFGVHLDVEVTQEPRILLIEDLIVPERDLKPGETFEVKVKMRPYRGKAIERKFTLNVPEDAAGTYEVVVRGGGIDEPSQESLLQGWRAITNLNELLREISSIEANNEVIVELRYETPDRAPWSSKTEKEDKRLLSEIKKEKMEKGLLKVFKSNYYVDGLLRKLIKVADKQK